MNTEELTMLLTRIQVLDNRQVDALTIEAWEPLMEDIRYDDAVDAVNAHFRSSEKYLQPVHVREGARVMRGQRIRRLSRTAVARIVELGGEVPRLWNGVSVTSSDELARVGELIENGDPVADDAVNALIVEARREVASIESGRAWARENLHPRALS